MKEWFSISELVAGAFPKMPASRAGLIGRAKKNGWAERRDAEGSPLARRRKGRGGGWEYHYSLFSSAAVAILSGQKKVEAAASPDMSRSQIWEWFDRQPESKKSRARKKLDALQLVQTLTRSGLTRDGAVHEAAAKSGVSPRSLYIWQTEIAGIDPADWLPHLCPRYTGRTKTAHCDPAAWEFFKADYLRLERPTAEGCYRRLQRAAREHGWGIPRLRVLRDRIEREIAPAVVVLARRGADALKAMYPAQERDRSGFHALQAVNADGHKFDVFVNWPGEKKPVRPVILAIQDLFSGKILSYRIDKTENAGMIRLAFGDLVETFGIPEHCYLDNGRGFASKWLTGGTQKRFRFKVKEEEPVGLLTQIGVQVHWTTPYSGQSKPIERAFRDLCDTISRHPALAGSWTGNNPLNKPENYGSKAVDLELFLKVVKQEICEHNARIGRRAANCAGRSFDQTFEASYVKSPIRKGTAAQRQLWLLAAEGVKPSRKDGTITLLKNRYWAEFLHQHRGKPLTVRFDPDDLHAGLFIYSSVGGYLGFADCVEAVGFADQAAAREHGRARRQYMRAQKEVLEAARKLTPADVAALIPETDLTPRTPEAALIKAEFGSVEHLKPAPKAAPALSDEERDIAAAYLANLNDEQEESNVIPLNAAANAPAARPVFDDEIQFARWVLANPERATQADRDYCDQLTQSPSIRLALGLEPLKNEAQHAF